MKNTTKLSLFAALAALLAPAASFADDPSLRVRLDQQRAEKERNERTTNVGLYAGNRGVGDRENFSKRRNVEKRAMIVHQGRGERIVIQPTDR
jgi:hypothetical protein